MACPRFLSRLLVSLALAGGLGASAQAAPILWTLSDVLFMDGGTASGSFVYDATTESYSNIAITTTDSSLVTNATYTAGLFGTATDVALVPSAPADQTGQRTFQLIYQFALTDAGGYVLLYDPFFPAYSSFDATCLNAGCSSIDYDRLVIDGAITGVPYVVPVPGAVWLLGSALAALGIARRHCAR